ncbi:catechol 2,3-dioxygenase-like lactoylglutathione lyase family enzyme [Saccharothrix tamanrassetensis]|uniref:Catechol 2,3-dioxygenase-like lactoylglutathione lyase family enzyme n=1 Tax=Saccharothrix tamanrassetensis TaxID=1051531 RepID=A0A841C7E4_9PSEU|nr:VOC family protein [Saccharothrix tamanrassetensis]MBB5954432.1 catechol 2,3-dioxygenase-like lactoylglutathione lyase family enzyme [Saccharothrix tamanrassetensis]
MIGTLQCVVLDCPEPKALAEFYRGLLGGEVDRPGQQWSLDADWSTLHHGGGVLAFQRVAEYSAPAWPDPAKPQQFHLDIAVEDLGVGKAEVLRSGGSVLDDSYERWAVFADPVGHPFCLVQA